MLRERVYFEQGSYFERFPRGELTINLSLAIAAGAVVAKNRLHNNAKRRASVCGSLVQSDRADGRCSARLRDAVPVIAVH
jgi:hypothetical protein